MPEHPDKCPIVSNIYSVKEIFYTIQGEGFHTGRPAVFLRFSGCNLWSGLEKDRHTAICQFCDTDFWGTDGQNGGKYSAQSLVKKCLSLWPSNSPVPPFIVCTGGEPLLQLDDELVEILHQYHFYIAIESNGTIDVPLGIDWICISPKAGAEFKVHKGNELKLVYPQDGIDIRDYEQLDFEIFSLQPLENESQLDHIQSCIDFCQNNPRWRLSLQTHKMIGIP